MIKFNIPQEFSQLVGLTGNQHINVVDGAGKSRVEKLLLAEIFTELNIIPKFFLVFSQSSMFLIEEFKRWCEQSGRKCRKINILENEIKILTIDNSSEILFASRLPTSIPYRKYERFICSIKINIDLDIDCSNKIFLHESFDAKTETISHSLPQKIVNEEALTVTQWSDKFLDFDDRCPPSKLHKQLDITLDRITRNRGRKVVVKAPRGGAKTSYITCAYVLKQALKGEEKFILLIGATWEDAKGYIQTIRTELEENGKLGYDTRRDNKYSWTKTKLMLSNGCTIQASASCGLRGRKARHTRPTLVILDDPAQDSHKKSKALRDRLQNWFFNTILKIGGPLTNYFVIGTAIHPDTLVCKLADNPDWEAITFQEIIKWPIRKEMWEKFEGILISEGKEKAIEYYEQNKRNMDEGAELLWPERWSLVKLMIERCVEGHTSFESERQNNPINIELSEFLCLWDKDYFEGLWFDDFDVEKKLCRVIYCDPSKGKKDKEGDFNIIVKLEVQQDYLLYVDIIAVKKDIWNFLKEDFVGALKDFNPDASGIEAIAFQELCVPIVNQFLGDGTLQIPPEPISDMTNKQVRIRRLTWYIANRRIRFKRFSPGVIELIEQLKLFPDKTAHDDAPDALEGAHRMVLDLLAVAEDSRLGLKN